MGLPDHLAIYYLDGPSCLTWIASNQFFSFQMPWAFATHSHQGPNGSKQEKAHVQASDVDISETSARKESIKCKCMGVPDGSREVSEAVKLSAPLGFDKDSNLDVQEAFGSLLNVQEILGASSNSMADEAEGAMSFQKAYERFHHPTPSLSGSLGAAAISVDGYSKPSDPFALGATVEARIKLYIVTGLFVPFEVLLASNKGLNIN